MSDLKLNEIAKFERWWSNAWLHLGTLEKGEMGDGLYKNPTVTAAWGAWQTVNHQNLTYLSPMHPIQVELQTLRERCSELEKELGRPYVVERGPWTVSPTGSAIESDDFTHDVILRVSGDFADDTERVAYSQQLANKLNVK